MSDVSFELHSGESLAIVGKSGSGKSTLLSCLLGLVAPNSGVIQLDGETLDAGRPRSAAKLRRQKIGMVFQGGELLPELSPRENVLMAGLLGGLPKAVAEERASSLLNQLGLPPMERLLGTFSGGEQQRVAVARALINRPRLLLADEPTGSLDTETRDEVIAMMESIPGTFDCAMVLVTHDLVVASGCARLARLQDGRLDETASVAGQPRASAAP